MGYDLHITRNATQSEDDFDGGIDPAEWESYVEADPSLRLHGYAEVSGPSGEKLRITADRITVWTEHPVSQVFSWPHRSVPLECFSPRLRRQEMSHCRQRNHEAKNKKTKKAKKGRSGRSSFFESMNCSHFLAIRSLLRLLLQCHFDDSGIM